MANINSVTIDSSYSPEQHEALVRQFENANGHKAFAPAMPTITIGGKTTHVDVGTKGRDGSRTMGIQTAYAAPSLRPGHVVIGGVETTVEAAIQAGLISREDAASGFKQPVERGARQWAATAGDTGTSNGAKGAHDSAQDRQSDTGTDTLEEAQHALEAAARVASETIQSIEQAHGPQMVDMGLDEVADSGYLPEADKLPEGVTADHLDQIVAGYTAQANDTLLGVGSSVNMLMETMTDDELREARRATIMGDASKMQHFGQQAVNRLALLPTANPEAFAEMVEGMSPAERKALSKNNRGEWIVTVPGRPALSFGAAVRAGIVRV
ncbi:hypothetical protein Amn_30980 [Aminobacter sp. Y103A]|uniref:hypothetical protein n=1 Tax=Aminobacter sp. Y103A TaxID=1870862 RepID=UPI002573CC06|nr:hypothetical protein [Aminobacter sp. SS-2016]BBD38218.1 hypothetical protein Amn_30980 [Aminobacter sp. SS-2016]